MEELTNNSLSRSAFKMIPYTDSLKFLTMLENVNSKIKKTEKAIPIRALVSVPVCKNIKCVEKSPIPSKHKNQSNGTNQIYYLFLYLLYVFTFLYSLHL